MPHLNLAIAFAAGVLGFFSPCVVPLIPGYLSFVSGVSLAESRCSTPVSASQAMTDELYPVNSRSPASSQYSSAAVTIKRT